jgi:hypothetical protein
MHQDKLEPLFGDFPAARFFAAEQTAQDTHTLSP